MPRPGTGLPIETAGTAGIEADPALLSEFIVKVLGIRANIQEHFGLTLDQPEPVVIADVLEAIRQRR